MSKIEPALNIIKPTQEQILAYAGMQQSLINNGKKGITLNEYLKNNIAEYKTSSIPVIADLRDMQIGNDSKDTMINLQHIDLTGSATNKNTIFKNCDLSNFKIHSSLDGKIADCKIDGADFRGAELKVEFGTMAPSGNGNVTFDNRKYYYQPQKVKLGMNKDMALAHTGLNVSDEDRDKEYERLITIEQEKLKKASKTYGIGGLFAKKTPEEAIKIQQTIGNLEQNRIDKSPIAVEKTVMHPSSSILLNDTTIYDVGYRAQAISPKKQDKNTILVPFTREDMAEYQKQHENKRSLTLDKFIKDKLKKENKPIDKNFNYIADGSGQDFSGMTIKGNLRGLAAPASKWDGCAFENCQLQNSDLSNSSFGVYTANPSDPTQTKKVVINNANFEGANISNANFDRADINKTNFNLAILDGTLITGATINNSSFDKAKIRQVDLVTTDIQTSTFNNATIEEMKFPNRVDGLQFAGAHINGGVLPAIIRNCDFTDSFMQLDAKNRKFENVILNNTTISKSDLSGASFEQASMRNVTMVENDLGNVSINTCNASNLTLSHCKGKGLQIDNSELTNSTIDHAVDLENMKIHNTTAANLNISHTMLTGVDIVNSKLPNLNINNTYISGKIEKSNLENSDLQNTVSLGLDLTENNLSWAKTNFNTNLFHGTAKDNIGMLKQINSEGLESDITLDKLKEQGKHINVATEQSNAKNLMGKAAAAGSSVLGTAREGVEKINNALNLKPGSKWGAIIGGVVAAVVVGALVASAVMTLGGSTLVIAGVAAGAAAIAGAGGAYVGKKIGGKMTLAGAVVAGGAAASAGLPPSLAIAAGPAIEVAYQKFVDDAGIGGTIAQHKSATVLAAASIYGISKSLGYGIPMQALYASPILGKALDAPVKALTGQTLDQLGDKAAEIVGKRLKEVADQYAPKLSPEIKDWVKQQQTAKVLSVEERQIYDRQLATQLGQIEKNVEISGILKQNNQYDAYAGDIPRIDAALKKHTTDLKEQINVIPVFTKGTLPPTIATIENTSPTQHTDQTFGQQIYRATGNISDRATEMAGTLVSHAKTASEAVKNTAQTIEDYISEPGRKISNPPPEPPPLDATPIEPFKVTILPKGGPASPPEPPPLDATPIEPFKVTILPKGGPASPPEPPPLDATPIEPFKVTILPKGGPASPPEPPPLDATPIEPFKVTILPKGGPASPPEPPPLDATPIEPFKVTILPKDSPASPPEPPPLEATPIEPFKVTILPKDSPASPPEPPPLEATPIEPFKVTILPDTLPEKHTETQVQKHLNLTEEQLKNLHQGLQEFKTPTSSHTKNKGPNLQALKKVLHESSPSSNRTTGSTSSKKIHTPPNIPNK